MNCHVVISNVFYDGTGNLLTETDALGNRVTYAYTPEGWLESVTRADGTVLTFAYDRTGSLLIQNVGDGQTVESSYNDIGMVTEVSGAEGSITYQYDERGYLLSVENVNGDVVSYTYDEYGNKTSMTYPDGRVVSYTYDRMNRMTGVTGLDGEVTTYTYDAAGRRTETSGSTLTTSYRYDGVGNLVEQVTHGESEIAFSYAYDRNGYITGEIRRENGTTVASSYAYDAAGQLTEFLQTTGYGEHYAYDKAGNMTEKVLTGTDGAETTLAMKYNKGNQLTGMANGRDKIAYKYDKNGSMVEKTLSSQTYGRLTDSYAYNALDQLTEYVGYDGYRQAFTYDANGMRQSKSEAGDANRSTLEELLRGNVAGLPEIVEPAQSQTNADEADVPAGLEWATTEYLYDLTQEYYQVISETTTYANGTSATTAYAYGLERIAAYSENGVTRYVYDGRGSVAQAVNVPVAGEAVSSNLPDISVQVQSFSYTAYGEQMGSVKAGGFTYNAEAYDAATGMLNLRARQYEPALNRFSQKDIYPANLLIPQSFNAYLFTYNSPVSFADGDGLTAKSLGSVLSSIGSKVQKVVSGIGNAVKTVASAIFGEEVVNTVVSGVKSVARTIRKAAQPIVDTVSTAWNKATQMYREAQEEISKLDKTAPDYHLQVDAIYRSACARYMGVEDVSAEPVSTGTMYTVDVGGMVLQSDKFGRGYLPGGTYTQQEILAFILKYGNQTTNRILIEHMSAGSHTFVDSSGVSHTITFEEELQNFIDANIEHATLQQWTPSFWQQAGQALEQAIKGDYAETTTVQGTIGQIVVGFIPVADTAADIRDLTYSAQQFWYKPSWENAGWVAVDLIGFIPIAGALKPVFKHGDEFIDAAGTVIKNADNMVDATGTVIRKADDVADVASDIVKHGDDFVQSLPSSKKLRRNLELAGVEVPDYPNAAHHIVAGTAPGAEKARKILEDFKIDINDASNGVFLPTNRNISNYAYHPSLHTDAYYEKVNSFLLQATNREEAIEILEVIGEMLSSGTFFD